ncbi:O-antigen ligase family protein [Mycolicibacterium mucogenicum]|uniref:O-antigen ligase family protein n=1 Tax=Mycolicibacterium mucogenicum TaxID=56689 RepID=UPI000A977658|nr:O-antigen ligase family protein [Mycolicibacterium mucogenicum]
MSLSQLICIAGIALLVCLVAPFAGWPTAFISGYLLTLGGVTTTLFILGDVNIHYGIAPGSPTFWLSDFLLALALLAIWASGGPWSGGWLLLIFAVLSSILLLRVWGNTPEQWSGLKLYMTAIVSFGIGRWLGQHLTSNAGLVLAWTSLVVCGIQFVTTGAQALGVLLVRPGTTNATLWINQGRMVGLYDHPSFLGKTVLLQLCFLLPLTASGRALTRRLATTAIVLGTVATVLTLARANIVAIGVAIVLWTILSNRATTVAVRLAIGGLVGGVLVAMNAGPIGALAARQLEDPYGGRRGSLLDIGLGQIKSALTTGTGPNYYSEVVGQYDPMAAKGFPVHNSFLYPIAELGLPIGLLFFSPLIVTVVWTALRAIREGRIDVKSAALLSLLPGIAVVAWTGWGMISWEILPLWFAGFGFLSADGDTISFSKHQADTATAPEQPARSAA